MFGIRYFLVFMSCTTFIECVMEPFMVGAKKAKIEDFPHSVLLYIHCDQGVHDSTPWRCSGSIINERIVLTNANCVYDCSRKSNFSIHVGSNVAFQGDAYTVCSYYIHESFNYNYLISNVALLRSKREIKFSQTVKRVALMKRAPVYNQNAQVAGWGIIDEDTLELAEYLQFANIKVWERKACEDDAFHGPVPEGEMCASNKDNSYLARYDTGNALMVRGYIQIGIFSHSMQAVSKSLAIFTDISYYYDWIVTHTKILYCHKI